MKIAILISGYIRTFKSNITSLKKNILDINNNIDIYIHITNDEYIDDKYINSISNDKIIEFITKELKPKCLLIENNEIITKNKDKNNIMNQWIKYTKLNNIKKTNEMCQNFTYDLVLKYRYDLNLCSPLDFNKFMFDPSYLYIPNDSKIDTSKLKNCNDDYICDIFAFGSSKNMDSYFDLPYKINYYIEKYGCVSETILYYHLKECNLQYKLIDLVYNVILSEINVFAVVGDSGSGKTTLGNKLGLFFDNSFILECDRYHKWGRGNDNWKNTTHLDPNANFLCKMQKDVFDLKIGNNILQVDYDHSKGTFTSPAYIESKNNLIVCGLHCLYDKNHIYNIKVFMNTDTNLKYLWKIKRDIKKRNYTLQNIINQIKSRELDYNKYILPQKDNADVIVNFYTDSIIDINNITPDILDKLPNVYLAIEISNKYNLIPIIENFQKFNNYCKIITKNNYIILDFKKYIYDEELFSDFIGSNYEMSNDFYDIIIYILIKLNFKNI